MRWIFRKTKLNLKLKRITYSSLLSGDVTFISNTSHSTVFAWIVSILEHSFAILWCTPAQGLIKNRHFCKIYIESLFFIFFFYFLFGFATQMSAFIDEHAAVSVCVRDRERVKWSYIEIAHNPTWLMADSIWIWLGFLGNFVWLLWQRCRNGKKRDRAQWASIYCKLICCIHIRPGVFGWLCARTCKRDSKTGADEEKRARQWKPLEK